MSNLIKVWRPPLTHPGFVGLTVPFSGQQEMTRPQYEAIMESRLHQLISKNPDEAYKALTSSMEHLPDLYEVATMQTPAEWPLAILHCGQMQMCLAQINFQKGQNLSLEASELPDLAAILEALPG